MVQRLIDDETENVRQLHITATDLQPMVKVVSNAYRLYDRSRSLPASQSVARSKELEPNIGLHPMFITMLDRLEAKSQELVHAISKFVLRLAICTLVFSCRRYYVCVY